MVISSTIVKLLLGSIGGLKKPVALDPPVESVTDLSSCSLHARVSLHGIKDADAVEDLLSLGVTCEQIFSVEDLIAPVIMTSEGRRSVTQLMSSTRKIREVFGA